MLNADNARIYGGDADSVWLAPYGTVLPTTLTGALDGAFEDVGWLHSDGIVETLSGSKSKIRGHQGQGVVRTRMTEPGTEYSFHALESKAQTKSLRYDEKAVTTAGGVRKATRGPGQTVKVRTAVIEMFDADNGAIKDRLCIPRFEITPNGDRTFAGSDIAGFPFLGEIIGNYDEYSSNPQPKTGWSLAIAGGPTGGTFTLQLNGYATAPIAYNAANSAIQSALNAISGVTGMSGIVVTGTGPFPITLPVAGSLAVTTAFTGGTSPSATVV